jgi:hypothetical protein
MYAFPQFVDGTSLATFLATSSALGVWKLQISKSYPDKFSVSDVAMKFTVSDAIAIIGQTAVFDQIWTSDSSMKLAVAHGAAATRMARSGRSRSRVEADLVLSPAGVRRRGAQA